MIIENVKTFNNELKSTEVNGDKAYIRFNFRTIKEMDKDGEFISQYQLYDCKVVPISEFIEGVVVEDDFEATAELISSLIIDIEKLKMDLENIKRG